ncbi:lipase family protein [Gordonia sp. NPDC003422]
MLAVAAACAACVGFPLPKASEDVDTTWPPPPLVVDLPHLDEGAMKARGEISDSSGIDGLTQSVAGEAAVARRLVYRSVSGLDGTSTLVSGSFFVPKGVAPTGGWPIVAVGHGTTGLANDCGPSRHGDLLGFASAVASLLRGGYAVAMADYQGLGYPGTHPYLEPRTAAFNVIDSVRALRRISSSVSDRWLGMGNSQGGQAVWAANELAPIYGTGLLLVGTLALAPAAEISMIAEASYRGMLTSGQVGLFPLIIEGVARTDPSFDVDSYLRGSVRDTLDVLVGCGGIKRKIAQAATTPDEVGARSQADAIALRDHLRRNALPQAALSAPMLVMNGAADEDIAPVWVAAAVSRSCSKGGLIVHRLLQGKGHTEVVPDAQAMGWVADRFAMKSAPSTCPV